MKNSKKILAFLLSACMLCAVPAVVSACNKVEEDPPAIEQPTEPSKVKDGTDISVAVGASATVTVSEYVTANGKTVTVQSSNPEVATAELNSGVVTILGKAKGTAIIKLKCESVEVSFNLTVTEEVKNTPAPTFEDLSASVDLRLDTFAEVTLAPKSGGDKFDLVYTLANSLVNGVEITANKLKFTPAETGKFEITVAVKCTEKDNAKTVYDLTFKVTVIVIESQEETVYFKVTVDGVETEVEAGESFTLPEYNKPVEDGKQFMGWTDGTNVYAAGSDVTVTGNLTITAVIENIPDVPPELVKESDTVELVLDTDRASATIRISDYLTTNGNAVRVEHSNDAVSVNSSMTEITVSAVKFGSSTVSIHCGSLTVTITVTVKYPPSQVKQDEVADSTVYDLYEGELVIDLAENITYNSQVAGYKVNGVEVDGSEFKVTGDYTETAREVTLTVTALFEDADPLEYTYKVSVKDTTAYRIVNGGFDRWEDGKPVGWTVTDGYGSEQTAPTYWEEERPFDNVGSYFGETDENKTGVLQTSTFIVGNSGWVSFQLGSAHHDAAIRVEIFDVTQNKTIAKFKNANWSDPENAQRLIPYKVDLSDYLGDSVYIKIVDEESDGPMGFKTFFADSFNSWHDAEPTTITVDGGEVRDYIKLGAPEFVNLTASVDLKDDNEAEIALPEAVYGMLATSVTYSTQTEGASIANGKVVFTAEKSGEYVVTVTGESKYGSTQFTVTVTVTNSKQRPAVEDISLGQINIDAENRTVTETLSQGNDNFDLSYAIKNEVDGASLNGKEFAFTAPSGQSKGTVEVTLVVTITDKAYPQDTYTEEITLSIEIVGNDPEIKENTVTAEFELKGNQSVEIELDLASNVTVPASVAVTYSVDGTEVEGSKYTATLNKGTHELTVKVHYGDGEELGYKYIVKVAQYSVINGDFETGDLDGWTYTVAEDSTDFGRVVNADNYFNGNSFNKQGTYLFTGVEANPSVGNFEAGMGTLKSSTFTLKQNGWISFLMGAAHNIYCGVRIVKVDGTVLAEFSNQGKGVDGAMDRYIYQFTDMNEDTDCYIEVFDNASSDWGCIAVDDFRTDWGNTIPDYENANLIESVYAKGQTQVYNGSFDKGNAGWNIVTTLNDGGVFAEVNTSGEDPTWGDNKSYNNDGNFLQNMSEKSKGYAVSSVFEVSENGWMTFKLGGNKAYSYVAIIDADTGEELAKFVNENYRGAWPDNGWEMYSYKVNLIESGIEAGRRVRIKVVDDATDDYGVVVADSFVTYYDAEPDAGFEKITKVN